MESKVTCRRCGREVLARTASKTGGYCRLCENFDEKEAAFERSRQFMQWTRSPMTDAEFDGALGIDDLEESIGVFFEKARGRLLDGHASESEKLVVAIEQFLGEIANGGVYQYLMNSSGAFAGHVPRFFRSLDLHEWSRLADEIANCFPGDVPANDAERHKLMETINWKKVAEIDARFNELWSSAGCTIDDCRRKLRDYVARNRFHFVHF